MRLARASRYVALAAALAMAGCAGHRPPDARACTAPPPEISATGTPAPHDTFNILILSGGGSRGAFGAGFLKGWTARQTGTLRPQFDLVTGVSTGALIAPFALLGSEWDNVLERNYKGIASDRLFSRRSIFSILEWNSFSDASRMEEGLAAVLDGNTLNALAAAGRQNRMVWVGATNIDKGTFTTFNLSAIAVNQPHEIARPAIAERIAASTSIPAFLPPHFIDGCMYADGGVRENLFIAQLEDSVTRAIAAARASRAEIYVVVNGPVEPLAKLTDNSLLAIGGRAFELGVQQIQLASLREAYYFARSHHYDFRWTSADSFLSERGGDDGKCGPQPITDFDSDFTRCLFEAGEQFAASNPNPWRTDLPGVPVSGAP